MSTRWIIFKARGAQANPQRPWQLWLADGAGTTFVGERSSHAFCVQVMDRLVEANCCVDEIVEATR